MNDRWSLSLQALFCIFIRRKGGGEVGLLIGASANLIVAVMSVKEGFPIRFVQYLKYGFPLM
ncbi:hypothetical protein GNF78_18515, partial [Clostridium perfringens]